MWACERINNSHGALLQALKLIWEVAWEWVVKNGTSILYDRTDACWEKGLWFLWLRCSPSLVALGSRAMPRPCWNFVTCDRFISDLLKCSGQVAWHWTSPRLPSRSLDGSFTILANLASILAKENSHLVTFALVQLKFVRRTHRDSATIRCQSLESCFLDS